MLQQDLWLTRAVAKLPKGTRGTGRRFPERAAFSPLGSTAIYRIPADWVTDVEPEPPAPIRQPMELGQRFAPLRLLALALLFLTGCHPVDEVRAAFGYGALFGAFVAVVVAVVVVRFRELEERRLDVGRALGSPGPKIRDMLGK